MGILAIFLASASDTKLSTFTQVCTAYSWFNLGGKLLKIAGLKRQLAEESDIKRKLMKLLGSCNNAEPNSVELEVNRAGLNRLKYSGVAKWFGAVVHRKDVRLRDTDLELELVRGVIIQERKHRTAATAIVVEDLRASAGLCMSPSEGAHRGVEVLPLPHLDPE
jgi:hypothetical protein